MTLNEELKSISETYDLSIEQISEMTGYAIDTVKAWRVSPESKKYRSMPERAMKLLKYEIEGKKLKPRE